MFFFGVLSFLAMWPRSVQVLMVFSVFLLKKILGRPKYLVFSVFLVFWLKNLIFDSKISVLMVFKVF